MGKIFWPKLIIKWIPCFRECCRPSSAGTRSSRQSGGRRGSSSQASTGSSEVKFVGKFGQQLNDENSKSAALKFCNIGFEYFVVPFNQIIMSITAKNKLLNAILVEV
jgi:hypothetical protein